MKCGITPENITELKENEIFVFGSNLAGIHGAGAAKLAREKFGARLGEGASFTGQCFALPTKDEKIRTLSLNIIKDCVDILGENIETLPNKYFLITKVGCGYAGYSPEQIAPMFKDFINYSNCSLPQAFVNVINTL